MGRLIFSAIQSLDGYVADAGGKFDWAEPDESMHTFANQLQRPVGMNLYGRRMYGQTPWKRMAPSGRLPISGAMTAPAKARPGIAPSRLLGKGCLHPGHGRAAS
jgi:dihydrofolate reductase